ncbi:MAG: hypothetical protein U0610_29220 [bacterium]
MRTCHACGTEVGFDGRVGFRDECTRCLRPLHICRNCRHWDEAAGGICREPVAEKVRDPERANLCEWFLFQEGERGDAQALAAARAAAEKLFKG